MKRLLGVFCVAALLPMTVVAQEDWAYPKQARLCSGYEVDPVDDINRFYMGVHANVSFLNWKNTYKDQSGTKLGSDSFSFETLLGTDIAVGYKFSNYFRIDTELGYIGKYNGDETERFSGGYLTEKTSFSYNAYYWTLNGYYDFCNGIYLGAGLGAAVLDVSLDHTHYEKVSKTSVSPMGALMVGWGHKLDSKIVLDLRYRLGMFNGGDIKMDTGGGNSVSADMGLMLDNTLSVGIRYSF